MTSSTTPENASLVSLTLFQGMREMVLSTPEDGEKVPSQETEAGASLQGASWDS